MDVILGLSTMEEFTNFSPLVNLVLTCSLEYEVTVIYHSLCPVGKNMFKVA